MVVFVPTFINIILNIRIFLYVRNSTRRVQPQLPSTSTNGNNIQNARISPREIALLKKMLFTFSMFIGGWSPVYFITVITWQSYAAGIVYQCSILLCITSVLSIIINLFTSNHELRQYLFNKIRRCFVR
jgi:hypothetical protein